MINRVIQNVPKETTELVLMLFTANINLAKLASESGVDRIVVDIETRGKQQRQSGYHLEINQDTIDDLLPLRSFPIERVLRLNLFHDRTCVEVERGIQAGATWMMLPMVRNTKEVERFVELVDGRTGTIALVETLAGLINLKDIASISGLDEIYLGLNDLSLESGWPFCYRFLSEGILDHFLSDCTKPYGFGGITVVDAGKPLSSAYIIKEYARLGTTLAILRRAFKKDIIGRDFKYEIGLIKSLYRSSQNRTLNEKERDQTEIWDRIRQIIPSHTRL